MSTPLKARPGIYEADPDDPHCPFCKAALVEDPNAPGWHDCPDCKGFSANFTDLDAKQAAP